MLTWPLVFGLFSRALRTLPNSIERACELFTKLVKYHENLPIKRTGARIHAKNTILIQANTAALQSLRTPSKPLRTQFLPTCTLLQLRFATTKT